MYIFLYKKLNLLENSHVYVIITISGLIGSVNGPQKDEKYYMRTEQSTSVQSVERTFCILEVLSCFPAGLPLMQVARQCGLHKSTTHRLLGVLVNLGYVVQDDKDGKYRLSLKIFGVGSRLINDSDMLSVSRTYLQELSSQTGEAVHLVVRDGISAVYIYKADASTNTFRMASRIGKNVPLYCTAVGKSMLANMPQEVVEDIWNKSDIIQYTEKTIVTLPQLFEHLNVIRRAVYAIDDEENELGVRCVAACILDYIGTPMGALSVSAPVSRVTEETMQRNIYLVVDTARQISQQLGGIIR